MTDQGDFGHDLVLSSLYLFPFYLFNQGGWGIGCLPFILLVLP